MNTELYTCEKISSGRKSTSATSGNQGFLLRGAQYMPCLSGRGNAHMDGIKSKSYPPPPPLGLVSASAPKDPLKLGNFLKLSNKNAIKLKN